MNFQTATQARLKIFENLPRINETTNKILFDRVNKYHISPFIALLDLEKAFNSVKHWAVTRSLINSIQSHGPNI